MFCENCGNRSEDFSKFCTNCGNKFPDTQSVEPKKKLFAKKKFLFAIVVVGIVATALILYFQNLSSAKTNYDVASAVVNVYCEDEEKGDFYGGSGTIFSEDGLVLTNAHIIPESAYDDVYVDDTLCIVELPDPETGSAIERYYAYPILIPELSEQYDLAFMQIHDVYYDFEENRAYGEYPKKFPVYADKTQCSDDYIKLGEPVRVYGYPEITGGYALTITDGVVSSLLPDEGLIVTSAKISYGNSGGLAVDENGCMIGVPSMVIGDENESFGVIISNDLISEFIDQLEFVE